MKIENISELHYITPIATVPSILIHGILSHKLAAKIPHVNIAMNEIQERRENKKVFGAKALYHYANLYFDAHNPMLSKLREKNDDLCILRIRREVLLLQNVVLTDRNASSTHVRFFQFPNGLEYLKEDEIFAKYWTHNDPFIQTDRKAKKCAKVLVPDKIPPNLIYAAYVCNKVAEQRLNAVGFNLNIEIQSDIFF